MATRLVLDEFDLNLAALAARLVIVVVVVVGGGARTLGAAVVDAQRAIGVVVDRRRRVLVVLGDFRGHGRRGSGRRGRASLVVRQPKLYAGACGEKVPRALVRWATRENVTERLAAVCRVGLDPKED